MFAELSNYFRTLGRAFLAEWNRFWFTASDPCVLGLMRCLTGTLLLWVLATYTPSDLVNLFGPDGYQPADSVLFRPAPDSLRPVRITYLYWIQEPMQLTLLHGAAVVVVLLFTIGLASRVTSVLSWLIAISYFTRAPLTTGELEPMLAMLLFYLMFAPSGAAFSVDAWLRRKQHLATHNREYKLPPSFAATIVTRLFQIHLTGVYLAMALGKFGGFVWPQGSAIWWLLARPETRVVDLTWLHGSLYLVVELWTFAILYYQLAFPIFIWNKSLRPLLLVLGVPVWILVGLATGQFEFAAAFLIGNLAFVRPIMLRYLMGERDGQSLCCASVAPPFALEDEPAEAVATPAAAPAAGGGKAARKLEAAGTK